VSQYKYKLNNDNLILYGFDAPTGGYYFTILDNDDREVFSNDGILLTKLLFFLKGNNVNNVNINCLIDDFYNAKRPLPLQIFIMKAFNKDVEKMLESCKINIASQFNR
jgi:hypothetical protein